MDEIWKPVVGYEGYYEVSDLGNVRGIERKVWKKADLRNAGCWITRKAGPACVTDHTPRRGSWVGEIPYKEARLCKDSKVRARFVHRLVWGAFNGSIPDKRHIDHIDNNPSNNCLDNLQCLTPLEHKRVTLERKHNVKILDRYWDMEGKIKNRGIAVRLSQAYEEGRQEAAEKAYKTGHAAGIAEGHMEADDSRFDALEKVRKEGFETGYKKGLEDSSDADRRRREHERWLPYY